MMSIKNNRECAPGVLGEIAVVVLLIFMFLGLSIIRTSDAAAVNFIYCKFDLPNIGDEFSCGMSCYG